MLKVVVNYSSENKHSGLVRKYEDIVYIDSSLYTSEDDAKCIAKKKVVALESIDNYIVFMDARIA